MILSDNAQMVAENRYFSEGEDWDKLCRRVSKGIANVEIRPDDWKDVFYEEIYNMYFIPGGRILRSAGKMRPSMLNCGCLPISDSIESIGETIKNALIMWSYGAGIGIDFSPLRPKGAALLTKGGESSGLISFLTAIDSVARTIETGGARRSGCLAMLHISHPEIFDFIDAKKEDKKLSYFNLSVAVNNDFLKAVENNDDWDLKFGGRVYETVKAVDLWNKILDSMIKTAEPGLINYDNLIKNNSFFYNPISCVNLCSEIGLAAYEMCDLGSLVLPKFVSNMRTNWKKLEESIHIAVRFLDNVLDVNFYPIRETEDATKGGRRLGLGIMGLHDYLMLKHLRYGSDEALTEIEKLFKFIRDASYMASIALAKEKGTFPKYIKSELSRASFIKKLPARIRMEIKEHGVRCVCVNSCQPTGTSSLLADVSSGVEPYFALASKRKDRVGERIYIHPTLKEFILSEGKVKPDWLIDSFDLDPIDHLETQATIQRFLDNGISKTINCPKNITVGKLSKLLLEYIADLKGVTIYADGCREGQVLERMTLAEATKIVKDNEKYESSLAEKDIQCKSGSCDL